MQYTVAGHCAAELAARVYEVRGTVRPSSGDPAAEGVTGIVRADLGSDEGWAEVGRPPARDGTPG